MAHTRTPDAAHVALAMDLHGTLGRYVAMEKMEQIAIMAQVIGHLVVELPSGFGTEAVMRSVAMNICEGNATSAQALADALHGASMGNG